MSSDYELRVSENIEAPAADVRDFLVELSNFSKWNPFLAMDPNSAIDVSSPSSGVGASYSWSSKKIGSGVMTITSVTDEVVDIHMKFTSRNKREDQVRWVLKPTSTGCDMTWEMTGTRTIAERTFVRVMKLDKVMSGHFADGLAQLKTLIEAK